MELPLTTPNARIEEIIAQLNEPLLVLSECFDVFTDPTGQKIAADRKSVAYRFHYREATRTLKTEEIDSAHQKVLEALTKGLGVKFR
jgi:phenylalanyl-tRNA synthetase beta chain